MISLYGVTVWRRPLHRSECAKRAPFVASTTNDEFLTERNLHFCPFSILKLMSRFFLYLSMRSLSIMLSLIIISKYFMISREDLIF